MCLYDTNRAEKGSKSDYSVCAFYVIAGVVNVGAEAILMNISEYGPAVLQ